MITLLLASVGVIVLAFTFLDALWSLIQLISVWLKPYFQPYEIKGLIKRFGNWAVVTGSTDGIGLHYSRELAKNGLNIVLISRNMVKLHNVARGIEQDFSVKTKVIQADFSQGDLKTYKHIEDELNGISVGILVNNVGKQYTFPNYIDEVPERELMDIINVNVGAVTMMTHMILPGMRQRKCGAIVNVSSGAELQPLPLMAVYAATKAYVGNLTAAVREECSGSGVIIQHLSPLFVSTKMNAFSERLLSPTLLVPDAATYARYAVSTLGKIDKTTGYWSHGIQYFLTKIPPVWIRTKIGGFMNTRFKEEYLKNMKIKQSI